jgi:hypothetical protein
MLHLLLEDPVTTYVRDAIRKRRLGGDKCSICEERRLEALVRRKRRVICAACDRIARGQSPFDWHHIAGRANCPARIRIPVNDHRAWLSPSQRNWPKQVLENPRRSPFVAVTAVLFGFIDICTYLIVTVVVCFEKLIGTFGEDLVFQWLVEANEFKLRGLN